MVSKLLVIHLMCQSRSLTISLSLGHRVKLEERNVDMLRLEKDQMNQDILESERQAREMGGLVTVKLKVKCK